jgi:hypothetical protein
LLTIGAVLYGVENYGRTGNGSNSVADIGGRTVEAEESVSAGYSRDLNGNKLISLCNRDGKSTRR